ncbi:AMP-binding protein [Streptomyces sp. PTM05]|uniref:AMP-binding protein n=1 Tax=Streptantibioticus parmotrematis TaxID=2873249 RepID=A0ABS7QZ16_9ACTN|nr:AMP-binding protein [Streptantibioticus parmotrematis]MBY8887027.1 AMP-binding protein [Streptantibioticus parmotrematis]
MTSQPPRAAAEPDVRVFRPSFDDPGDMGLSEYVLGRASAGGDRLAVVDRSRGGRPREWTYQALKSAVHGLAGHLRDIGLRQDDVVAVLTETSSEFVIAYYGVLAAGGVVLCLDPRGTETGWKAELALCRAQVLVVETALWPCPPRSPKGDVHIGQCGKEVPTWSEVIAPRDAAGYAPGGHRRAVLMSSSGTQGLPKKVVLTHRNLTAGLAQIASVHRVGDGEAVTCVGPLRHIYGMQMAMNPVLRAGGTLVITAARFHLTELLDAIREHHVAVAYLVPSVIVELADLPSLPDLPGLRLIVSGGGPLAASAATECSRRTRTPMVQGFGMTEAGCVSFTPDSQPGPVGSIGVVLPGTEARFADPGTGEPLAPGQAGELWVRGPQITPGYLEDPGPSAWDRDGWFRTGDLAIQDSRGYLRIVGRVKSLIKYKGHQVAPAELEALLLAHPAVVDAMVIGEPDSAVGELPKAFVVASRDVSLREIAAYVAARVAAHKRIRRIERVREIPRSAMGKPARPAPLRVIVTAGSTGPWRHVAAELVGAGAYVLITGEEEISLAEVTGQLRGAPGLIASTVVDTGSAGSWADTAYATFGGIDVFIDTAHTGLLRAMASRMAAAGWGRLITPDTETAADVARELTGTDVSVVAYHPGHLPSRPAALMALATGAVDHLSGSCSTAEDLECP